MGLGLGLGVDVSQLWTEPLLLVHPGQMVVSADATNDSTYMGAGSGEHGGSVATAHWTGECAVGTGLCATCPVCRRLFRCARCVQCAQACPGTLTCRAAGALDHLDVDEVARQQGGIDLPIHSRDAALVNDEGLHRMWRGSTGLDASPSWLGAEARGEGYQEEETHLPNDAVCFYRCHVRE